VKIQTLLLGLLASLGVSSAIAGCPVSSGASVTPRSDLTIDYQTIAGGTLQSQGSAGLAANEWGQVAMLEQVGSKDNPTTVGFSSAFKVSEASGKLLLSYCVSERRLKSVNLTDGGASQPPKVEERLVKGDVLLEPEETLQIGTEDKWQVRLKLSRIGTTQS